ncbi:hypothetical protein EDB82DRAFT_12756 [Fusarium venenatum]|uniref:uncharacterized protein n=1 Tax=Fusarium venenatum TaxID=56646 RepID=UPI001DAA767D|nr:hypothetical protein EDB82DRAFT_12756 [Fusarium venenatum]
MRKTSKRAFLALLSFFLSFLLAYIHLPLCHGILPQLSQFLLCAWSEYQQHPSSRAIDTFLPLNFPISRSDRRCMSDRRLG